MENAKQPVFLTVQMLKGGVGKSVIAYNFMMWLAIEKNKKVLGIDLDENCNFSQVLDVYDQEGTVANILTGEGDVKIHHITDNVDLIGGFNRLHDVQEDNARSEKKTMMLYMWLEDNYDRLNLGQYDFIIIDTHNDFGTATKNAVAVSHLMISPIEPVDFSATATVKQRLEEFKNDVIDFRTRESYITTDLKFVGNKIRHTKNGKEFEERIANDEEFIAKFRFKEPFNTSIQKKTPISLLLKKPRNQDEKDFKQSFDENMEYIYQEAKKYQ
ncbi:TPA: ParA family protein [Staphylococcus aureus]|uniref:ParA family protein n=1 Tax=Staphylococcus aureus TaxID=1280 RepID=UPI00085C8C74|nr:ParA family protein [Staphylococcus aureus]HCY0820879.1 ParA family protein [Staphylococcus aureus]HDG8341277.1 ParA family protein [Staphylococcus aureus]HDG8540766.1 ParA family protein [Staphylococcus aureus]HDG8822027.1 ParA family protein [Staphylococcus aureus]HDJ2043349.1 ParA family protein [Staphylococcus aureus]